ncbi:hypothetical protein [Microbacterium sp. CGR1]|uniref:hypothetical protein n=1 Tax=Microbacterium sp. CGR1 TaxID=1696072 RepID=UPI00069D79A8|nr:hypothetical protein [Microbacterium sp. CGR1]
MRSKTPPVSLDKKGRALWKEITSKYLLRSDELETLKAACGEADLISRIEEELKDAPLTTKGSMGQIITHPLLTELRQHRVTMAALLRGLKLPDENSTTVNAQREGGLTRWEKAHGKAV